MIYKDNISSYKRYFCLFKLGINGQVFYDTTDFAHFENQKSG